MSNNNINNSNNTLQEKWEAYKQYGMHPEAGKAQVECEKRAFYAGAFEAMGLSFDISQHSEEAAVAMLDGVMAECEGFFAEMVEANNDATNKEAMP